MIAALEAFAARLPRQARVLFTQDVPEARSWLAARGIETQVLEAGKDLRFLTLKKDTWDGIWAEGSLQNLKIEDAQRVIAIFFPALKAKSGVLFITHPYPEAAFSSMFRQNGFHALLQGERNGATLGEGGLCPPTRVIVAQRI